MGWELADRRVRQIGDQFGNHSRLERDMASKQALLLAVRVRRALHRVPFTANRLEAASRAGGTQHWGSGQALRQTPYPGRAPAHCLYPSSRTHAHGSVGGEPRTDRLHSRRQMHKVVEIGLRERRPATARASRERAHSWCTRSRASAHRLERPSSRPSGTASLASRLPTAYGTGVIACPDGSTLGLLGARAAPSSSCLAQSVPGGCALGHLGSRHHLCHEETSWHAPCS